MPLLTVNANVIHHLDVYCRIMGSNCDSQTVVLCYCIVFSFLKHMNTLNKIPFIIGI